MATATAHDLQTLINMSCYNRALYVRAHGWSPISIPVILTDGTKAVADFDANGDRSLWCRSGEYRGTLSDGYFDGAKEA